MSGSAPAQAREAPLALVVLGQPVAQSLSPVFQNAALRAAAIDVMYTRREVAPDELAAAFRHCRDGRVGGNVTMPHKAAVFALCAATTDTAQRTGAVNTFWWDGDALVGHNTDVQGVAATIMALCPQGVAGDVVLLGAGGAAAAVLVALGAMEKAYAGRTFVVARTPGRALALGRQTGEPVTSVAGVHEIDWTRVGLVVNATPIGMHPDDVSPMPVSMLAPHTAVFDLVYRREGTAWVKEAKARGLPAEDGLRMLVEQGAAAFACWFGRQPSRDVMWEALGLPRPEAHAPRR